MGLNTDVRQADALGETDPSEPHRSVRFGIEELSESGPAFNKFTFKPRVKQPPYLQNRAKPRTLSK